MKQGKPFEGKRGQRVSATEQFRQCAPVRLTEPGPRKPHHLTAVAVGHVRTLQGPCTTRGSLANKCSLDCNGQRTVNARSTHGQRTVNAGRSMLKSPGFKGGRTFKEFFLLGETFEHASMPETRHY